MSKYVINEGMLSPVERDILFALRKADRKNTEKAMRWLADHTQEGVA